MPSEIRLAAGKAASKSLTIWSSLSAIVGVLALHLFGVEIPVEQLDEIGAGLGDVIVKGGVVLSGLVSIYGRLRASERIQGL